jgi:large repetitive protein
MVFKKNIVLILAIIFCTLSIDVFANDNLVDTAKQFSAITLILTPINSTCQKENGKIIANVSGGVLPYSYTITDPNNIIYPWNSNIFPSLPAGIYMVTVTDAIGTTVSQTATVGNTFNRPTTSLIGLTTTTTATSQDATLSFSAANGTPPYTYSLDNVNFQASNTFTNLAGGFYYRIAKDANGCSSFTSTTNGTVTIPNDPQFLLQNVGISGGSTSCNPYIASLLFNSTGYIGGTPPYSFSLDGINFQTTQFYNLSQGVYTIRIKDAVGEMLLQGYTLVDYCDATFSIFTTTQTAICGTNGSITATAALGEAPYQYSIDGINFSANNIFTGLGPGGYTITVKDSYNFINSKYVIVPNNCVQVIPTTISSTCGNSNGSITAQASNGTTPYEYSLNGGAYSSTNLFTGLAASNYVVRAKDATSRVATANTVVSNIAGAQITAADTTATGCNNNTGTISVQVQAGTAPYLYSINGTSFVNTALFTGLAQNNYTVTVKDARGCLTTKPALITLVNNLAIDAGNTVNICEGKNGTTNAVGNAVSYAWQPSELHQVCLIL